MNAFDELTQLYNQHSTAAIEAGGGLLLQQFGVATAGELLAIDGYTEAFGLVSACASALDKLVARYPDPQAQARESLRVLRRMLDDAEPPNKIEVTRRLVEGRLRNAWPAPQQLYFDDRKEILEWRDFFVSYTNRDAPATNQQFRQLIKSCLGTAPKGAELQSNYLARVIARHLRRYQGLTGFFDEDDLKIGESINHGVDAYCARAFALVQVIEPLSFDKEPPRNWCFHEYTTFSQNPAVTGLLGDKDRHFFILTDTHAALQPANPIPAYSAWHGRISTLKQANVSVNGERNTTLRAKVKAIATEIVKLRTDIIDAWLAH